MGRGRPRKPTSQHKLEGTFRADRHEKNEPRPSGEPYKIGELGVHALVLWDRVVPELVRMKVATAIDSPELFAMCEWWGEYRDLQTNKEMDPYNRACAMAASYKQFRSIAARFGLTPADRAKLDIDEADPNDNPFFRFMMGQSTTDDGEEESDEQGASSPVHRRSTRGKNPGGKAPEGGLPKTPRRPKKRQA
jgi:phage terminase small subunit